MGWNISYMGKVMIDIWWLERIEEESLCVVGFNLCYDLYIVLYFIMFIVFGERK